MRSKYLYLIGFLVSVGIVTYGNLRYCTGDEERLPPPPRIVATGIAYIGLDLFSLVSEELASIMAIGFTLGMLVNTQLHHPDPNDPNAPQCGPHCGSSAQAADMIFYGSPDQMTDNLPGTPGYDPTKPVSGLPGPGFQ